MHSSSGRSVQGATGCQNSRDHSVTSWAEKGPLGTPTSKQEMFVMGLRGSGHLLSERWS